MREAIVHLVPFVVLLVCLPQDDPGRQIHDLIEKLRSDRIEERQQGEEGLKKAGKAAIPALRKAAKDRDLEVAQRAGLVLRVIEIREKIPARVREAMPGVEERLARLDKDVWGTLLREAADKRGGVSRYPQLDLDDLRELGALVVHEAGTREQKGRACSYLDSDLAHHAYPAILEWLKDKDPDVRRWTLDRIYYLYMPRAVPCLLPLLEDPSPEVRWRTASALGRQGERQAIPGLLRSLEDPDRTVRRAAAQALAWLDEKRAIPALLKLLDEEVVAIDFRTASALGRLEAKEALPKIIPFLDREGRSAQESACFAIECLRAKEAWPALVKLLEQESASLQRAARSALVESRAEEAVPALMKLLGHPEAHARESALEVLGELNARTAIPQIIPLLEDDEVRQSAIETLTELGAVMAAPRIAVFLEDPTPGVRRSVSTALAHLGYREAIPGLQKLLADKSPYVRGVTAKALARLRATGAIPDLVELLEDNTLISEGSGRVTSILGAVSQFAAEALAQFEAAEVGPPLLAALTKRPSARFWAARTLGEKGVQEAIPTLRKFLKEGNSQERSGACAALGKLGDSSSGEEFEKLLEEGELRYEALEALVDLGRREAAPRIARILLDPHAYLRKTAVQALGRLGIVAAVPEISRRLKDVDGGVRAAAIEALGRLSVKARGDEIALRLEDFEIEVRRAAASWLCVLGSRRGVPTLLEMEDDLFFLNALRLPEQWSKFAGKPLVKDVRGSPSECWRRLAGEAGLKMADAARGTDVAPFHVPRGLSIVEAIRTLGRTTDREVVLEPDGIRVLPRDEALKFWRAWGQEEKK